MIFFNIIQFQSTYAKPGNEDLSTLKCDVLLHKARIKLVWDNLSLQPSQTRTVTFIIQYATSYTIFWTVNMGILLSTITTIFTNEEYSTTLVVPSSMNLCKNSFVQVLKSYSQGRVRRIHDD